ncbi:MAG: hypothetical protein ACJATT_001133 [Myxococcota bacterium]
MPLLVSSDPDGASRIVFATFYVEEEPAGTMNDLLNFFVGSLDGTERCVGIE